MHPMEAAVEFANAHSRPGSRRFQSLEAFTLADNSLQSDEAYSVMAKWPSGGNDVRLTGLERRAVHQATGGARPRAGTRKTDTGPEYSATPTKPVCSASAGSSNSTVGVRGAETAWQIAQSEQSWCESTGSSGLEESESDSCG
ncbi:MAG: hypothetical protein R3C20_00495 [Planctomycetaceae bacterium]